jgi:glucose-6-phosphate isomerase
MFFEKQDCHLGSRQWLSPALEASWINWQYKKAGRARLPMWDWVGGRTSVFSAVGLLPAALQGIDLQELLMGARLMDQHGREKEISRNPAAQLALNWWYAGSGRGEKAMVVLPYKDRLSLFSNYLQQLVMESLGKERDLEGRVVRQGLTVYGNKGSTDQHAYVQQLREGRNDFFAQFLEVLKDQEGPAVEVDSDITSGDYLVGFLVRNAAGFTRETASVNDIDPGFDHTT